ncbi:MAG: lipopolysaccharide biosynthesis protein [Anaerolineae bacterium]|nr:lipopolysaccharide biosynthesis protein [Anaerolineae bacterium]
MVSKKELTQASARGVIWLNAGQIFNQAFGLVNTVVLARLLTPADFGLIGMAMVFMNFLSMVNELGLAEAIVQREELDEAHLSSAFWANFLFGFFLFVITLLSAPSVAWFFEETKVQTILLVLGIDFFVGSLGSVHRALLNRAMQFELIALGQTAMMVTRVTISIILAVAGFGVWSIIIGYIFGTFADSLVAWICNAWRPKLLFERSSLSELFGFSLNLLGARAIAYVGNNTANVLTGKYLGASMLGIYSIASNIPALVRTRLATSIAQAVFPAFSSIQGDNERMRKAYLKIVRYVSIITFPMLVGLAIVAPEFIRIVYGLKWSGAIIPLQITCFGVMFASLGIMNGPIQKAKGRTDLHMNLVIVSVVISIVTTLIGINYGLVGIAIASSFKSFIWVWIAAYYTGSLIDLSVGRYLKAMGAATLASIFMTVIVMGYRYLGEQVIGHNDFIMLTGSIILGAGSYILALKLFKDNTLTELFQIGWEVLHPFVLLVRKKYSSLVS